jgi:hypothetical protein
MEFMLSEALPIYSGGFGIHTYGIDMPEIRNWQWGLAKKNAPPKESKNERKF